jgi:peptidoglycan DL-endopeptidase LytE
MNSKQNKMNYIKILIIILFFCNASFSQENYIKHRISKGETLTSISEKYGVKIKEILQLNPKSKGILKLNAILKIPNSDSSENKKDTSEPSVSSNELVHNVFPKETLYSISKVYGITVESIIKANPIILNKELGIGTKLIIPLIKQHKIEPNVTVLDNKVELNNDKTVEAKPIEIIDEENTEHEVLPKETKYGISKQYGITIQELESQNPEIINGLQIGYKLKIKNFKKSIQAILDQKPVVINTDENLNKEVVSNVENTTIQNNSESENSSYTNTKEDVPTEYSNKVNNLVANAFENIGVRYRMGGTSRSGFDCSGLMITAFNTIDVKLPRTSREQSKYGNTIDKSEAKKGDLIFFSTNGSGSVNHVGMIVEVAENDIKFIHASVHSGVVVSSINERYYSRSFIKVNRVLQ